MAWPLRTDVPNGIYHVTARGPDRLTIVRDDADREKWTELLAAGRGGDYGTTTFPSAHQSQQAAGKGGGATLRNPVVTFLHRLRAADGGVSVPVADSAIGS
ncbi:MAG: hypothetical protein GXP27_16850 [Planctomycetes bacterium]|nr:hypothetical protein [Planctomycetota bacterium]